MTWSALCSWALEIVLWSVLFAVSCWLFWWLWSPDESVCSVVLFVNCGCVSLFVVVLSVVLVVAHVDIRLFVVLHDGWVDIRVQWSRCSMLVLHTWLSLSARTVLLDVRWTGCLVVAALVGLRSHHQFCGSMHHVCACSGRRVCCCRCCVFVWFICCCWCS